MGRKRTGEIEKEENRKIAEMVTKIVGERSYKEAGLDAGIDASTLSYICRGKVKPTPDIVAKITKDEAKPQGGIGYDELMIECGYQSDTLDRISMYAGLLSEAGTLGESVGRQISKDTSIYISMEEKSRRVFLQAIIEKGYGVLAQDINYDSSVNNGGYGRVDVRYLLASGIGGVDEWLLDFNFAPPGKMIGSHNVLLPLGKILIKGIPNPNQKISMVVNSKLQYEKISKYKGKMPFRGELSIILIDVDNLKILDETYLSHYDLEDTSKEMYII
ncbi:hypothetical protein [Butyrivibrio sp. MB2005]|uniref:hypothetical protein n=1 Tax=Butyrivibrio sp. MB2005 TaxID=1280678 RepID=UPI0004247E4A|nr:hypothetical protein [Butyrivibrio sp. MB2005]